MRKKIKTGNQDIVICIADWRTDWLTFIKTQQNTEGASKKSSYSPVAEKPRLCNRLSCGNGLILLTVKINLLFPPLSFPTSNNATFWERKTSKTTWKKRNYSSF